MKELFFQKRDVPLWKAPIAKIAALRPNPNALTQGPIPEKRWMDVWTRIAFSCNHEWVPIIFLCLTANQEQLTGDRVLTLCCWISRHWCSVFGYAVFFSPLRPKTYSPENKIQSQLNIGPRKSSIIFFSVWNIPTDKKEITNGKYRTQEAEIQHFQRKKGFLLLWMQPPRIF